MAYSIASKTYEGLVTSFKKGLGDIIDISYEPVSTMYFWEQVSNKGFLRTGKTSVFSFSTESILTGVIPDINGHLSSTISTLTKNEANIGVSDSLSVTLPAGDFQSASNTTTYGYSVPPFAKSFMIVRNSDDVVIYSKSTSPPYYLGEISYDMTNVVNFLPYMTIPTESNIRTTVLLLLRVPWDTSFSYARFTITLTGTSVGHGTATASLSIDPNELKLVFQ